MLSVLIFQGTWECRDGATDVDFRNWEDYEPDNGRRGPAENCGKMWASAWGDVSCYKLFPAVCKQSVA